MKRKSKILIIGGTRYIGALLKKKLKKKNFFKTLSLSHSLSNNKSHIICDRNKKSKLYLAIKKFDPDIIIDMINFTKKNSDEMSYVYESKISPSLKHYIVLSTFFVYKFINHKKFSEKEINITLDKKKYDKYTRNKIEMEQSLYKSKLFDITTIVRLPYVFSHDDYTGRFQKFCELAKRFKNVSFSNKNKFSMISKTFAVKCILELVKKKPQKFVDLANKGNVTNQSLIKILRNKFKPIKNKIKIRNKNNPYFVNKNLCISSKKIKFNQNIINELKKESHLYFKKIH